MSRPEDAPDREKLRSDAEEATRRRRRAQVFGDVLPDGTTDERGDRWGEREADSDDWLRGEVPPHHGSG